MWPDDVADDEPDRGGKVRGDEPVEWPPVFRSRVKGDDRPAQHSSGKTKQYGYFHAPIIADRPAP